MRCATHCCHFSGEHFSIPRRLRSYWGCFAWCVADKNILLQESSLCHNRETGNACFCKWEEHRQGMETLTSAMGRTFCLCVGLMVESFGVEDKYSHNRARWNNRGWGRIIKGVSDGIIGVGGEAKWCTRRNNWGWGRIIRSVRDGTIRGGGES